MKMLKSDLEKRLNELFINNLDNSKLQKKVTNELFKENGIPTSTTSDLMSLRTDSKIINIEVKFALLNKLAPKEVTKYFDDNEIKKYKSFKHETEAAEFPISFDVIQIKGNQWIGKITVSELMKLSNSQLINYNENAQRVLKRIVRDDVEYYRIQLNKKAIEKIRQSFEEQKYIPNTITLNIPEDNKSKFYYDNDNKQLIVKSVKAFDILDGYHRFIAMSNAYVLDQNFDYIMELRVTNFSDEMARQFIWQEDQKTKMLRIDSDSLNIYDAGNITVKKIIESGYSNIVGRTGVITDSSLSRAINIIYFNNKQPNNSDIVETKIEICKCLDKIQESYPTVFDKPLKIQFVYCMIYMFRKGRTKYKTIDKFYKTMCEQYNFNHTNILSVSDVKKMDKTFGEVVTKNV